MQRSKAEELRRQSGQERLLRAIGETARLEERRCARSCRPTIRGRSRAPPRRNRTCRGARTPRLQDDEVVFAGPSPAGQGGREVRARPRRRPAATTSTARGPSSRSPVSSAPSEWTVTFQLDSEGTDAFATATTEAVGAPPPTDQIAIIVDRVATPPDGPVGDHGWLRRDHRWVLGAGARPRHPAERRRIARGAHATVGAYGEPDAG